MRVQIMPLKRTGNQRATTSVEVNATTMPPSHMIKTKNGGCSSGQNSSTEAPSCHLVHKGVPVHLLHNLLALMLLMMSLEIMLTQLVIAQSSRQGVAPAQALRVPPTPSEFANFLK